MSSTVDIKELVIFGYSTIQGKSQVHWDPLAITLKVSQLWGCALIVKPTVCANTSLESILAYVACVGKSWPQIPLQVHYNRESLMVMLRFKTLPVITTKLHALDHYWYISRKTILWTALWQQYKEHVSTDRINACKVAKWQQRISQLLWIQPVSFHWT